MMKRLLQTSQLPQVAEVTVTSSSSNNDNNKNNVVLAKKPSPRPSLAQTARGPSLLGLLAAKRLTRKLQRRYGHTAGSVYGSSRFSTSINIQREPNYRMEPHNKFDIQKVEDIIKRVIDARMEGFKYHPRFCSNMCKGLSDEIKDRVKKLRFDRYKIVAVVHIGEKREQCTVVCSRCAWDSRLDNFATYSMETDSLFCTASVYGVYTE